MTSILLTLMMVVAAVALVLILDHLLVDEKCRGHVSSFLSRVNSCNGH